MLDTNLATTNVSLIATIASGLGLALIMGLIADRLRLPALVGYLIAGVIIGPFTPGYVANLSIAHELAEIGVMLLMFGVGLHFSIEELWSVRKLALPGAILQILVATILGALAALSWGWSMGTAVIFGLSLSVASTVVLLRGLESRNILDSVNGRIAVGWLVVEDLVMVIVLVLLPALGQWLGGDKVAPQGNLLITLLFTLIKVSAFIAFMLVVGRKFFPKLLWLITRTGSRELFTLCVVAAAISIAYVASELFGVSFALGAFFAGVVMRESEFSQRAAEESLPLREAFAVLFFVSVGMLLDPKIIFEEPLRLAIVLGIIILGKSLASAVLVISLRYPLNTALTVSASLAQIGEFSFILAGLGVTLGVLSQEAQSLIMAGALISIAVNPLIFAAISPFQKWLCAHSALAQKMEWPTNPLTVLPPFDNNFPLSNQVILVGYGRVGRRIADNLTQKNIPFVVIETSRKLVKRLRDQKMAAILGDAANPHILVNAQLEKARVLVIATPDTFDVRQMLKSARRINTHIITVVRTHNEEEAHLLKREMAQKVFLAEDELAQGMSEYVLEQYDV